MGVYDEELRCARIVRRRLGRDGRRLACDNCSKDDDGHETIDCKGPCALCHRDGHTFLVCPDPMGIRCSSLLSNFTLGLDWDTDWSDSDMSLDADIVFLPEFDASWDNHEWAPEDQDRLQRLERIKHRHMKTRMKCRTDRF